MEGAGPLIGRPSLPERVTFRNQAQNRPFLFEPKPGMWTGAQDASGDLKSAPRVGFQYRRFGHDFPLTAWHRPATAQHVRTELAGNHMVSRAGLEPATL